MAGAAQDEAVGEAAEVSDAHRHVRLETTGGEDDAATRSNIDQPIVGLRANAANPAALVEQELAGGGGIADDDARGLATGEECVDEALAAARRSPAIAGRVGRAPVPGDTVAGEPLDGPGRVLDENVDELPVGAAAREA